MYLSVILANHECIKPQANKNLQYKKGPYDEHMHIFCSLPLTAELRRLKDNPQFKRGKIGNTSYDSFNIFKWQVYLLLLS